MNRKIKYSATAIYIAIIVPLMITYALSLIQIRVFGGNYVYYKKTELNISNVLIILIAITLILTTYYIKLDFFQKIIYNVIGIFVNFIEKIFSITKNGAFVSINTLQCILMIGYIISIAFLILQIAKQKKQIHNLE